MMEQMTKDDLKTGMHVVTREGMEFVVLKDTLFADGDILVAPHDEDDKSGNWLPLDKYNDNLTFDNAEFSCFDIVRVYQPKYEFTTLEYKLDCSDVDLSDIIFAEEVMTRAEAEEKFGIRIID
jgi:hypothetical protein